MPLIVVPVATFERPSRVLPALVFSQFAGTSLWFAGNASINELQQAFNLPDYSAGFLSAAVQVGFVLGTLVFAFFSLADRLPASLVFLWCSVAGACCNLAMLWQGNGLWTLLSLRFATGIFLAGIYPVGIKIAASWWRDDLGGVLGYLLGALVLGTAFPFLLRATGASIEWRDAFTGISILALIGGLVVRFGVPPGPFLPAKSRFDFRAIFLVSLGS